MFTYAQVNSIDLWTWVARHQFVIFHSIHSNETMLVETNVNFPLLNFRLSARNKITNSTIKQVCLTLGWSSVVVVGPPLAKMFSLAEQNWVAWQKRNWQFGRKELESIRVQKQNMASIPLSSIFYQFFCQVCQFSAIFVWFLPYICLFFFHFCLFLSHHSAIFAQC